MQAQLDGGQEKNRAALARRHRLTRARVTQILGLLDLHPPILAFAEGLTVVGGEIGLSERSFRELRGLHPRLQLELADRELPGFAEWRHRKSERSTA